MIDICATPQIRLPGATVFAMAERGLEVVRMLALEFPDEVEAVVIGRNPALMDDHAEDIIALCRAHGFPHYDRDDASVVAPKGLALAVAWRWLLDVEEDRLIILHDSPLPRYRGFAPLVNALINGEREIGVTALFGSAEYDRGDIIFQQTSAIDYPITVAEAIEINTANYLTVTRRIFACLAAGNPLPRTPQNEARASYSIWRDEDDYRIDWKDSANAIARMIDAVGPPYGGAITGDGRKLIRIKAAHPVGDVTCEMRHPGKVLFVEDGLPVVICGRGLLKIREADVLMKDRDDRPYLPLSRFRIRFR